MRYYDVDDLIAEYTIRLELWLSHTLEDIDSNTPPLMSDFYTEQAKMLGFLEAIEFMSTVAPPPPAKLAYENMSDAVKLIIQRAEPEIL